MESDSQAHGGTVVRSDRGSELCADAGADGAPDRCPESHAELSANWSPHTHPNPLSHAHPHHRANHAAADDRPAVVRSVAYADDAANGGADSEPEYGAHARAHSRTIVCAYTPAH